MSDHPPIEFITPINKHTILLKPIMTGYDQEAIDAELYRSDEDGLPATLRANRKAIQLLVISVDGNSENVVDDVLGLDVRDFKAVIAAVDGITENIPEEKKTTSDESTASTPSTEPSTPTTDSLPN